MDQAGHCQYEVNALQTSKSWLQNSSSSRTTLYRNALTSAHLLEVENCWKNSSGPPYRKREIGAEQFDKRQEMRWLTLWKGKRGIARVDNLLLGQEAEREHDYILACLGGHNPDTLKNWTKRDSNKFALPSTEITQNITRTKITLPWQITTQIGYQYYWS